MSDTHFVDQEAVERKRQLDEFKKIRHDSQMSDDQYLKVLERDSTRDEHTGRLVKSPIGGDLIFDEKGKLMEDQTQIFFSHRRIFSQAQTTKLGEPTYIIKEFGTIIPPRYSAVGGKYSRDYSTWDGEVTPLVKFRFPKEYAAFKAGKQLSDSSKTPLNQWDELRAYGEIIESLALIDVTTVRDLAETSEIEGSGYVKDFGTWKAKAKGWIRAQNKSEERKDIEEELTKRDTKIEVLTGQVEKLLAALAAQQSDKSVVVDNGPEKPTPVRKKYVSNKKITVESTPQA